MPEVCGLFRFMKKSIPFLLLCFLSTIGSAQYKSLLWKISGNGLKEPSYLLGTMHTADSRVVTLGNKLAGNYFKSAKAYAMELDPGEELNMNMLDKLMMGDGYSLSKMIPPKEYALLDSLVVKQSGLPMAMFDNIAPVFVMTIFESMSMGLTDSATGDNTQILDINFYNQAKDEDKKIIGIETSEEQLKALGTLSYKEQAELLVQEIDSFQANQSDGTDLVKYYLAQDLDKLAESDNDVEKNGKFYKALVIDRNERMANRIAEFIKNQSTFIAIGAMHLPDKEGVIERLRKKGFKVEPIK